MTDEYLQRIMTKAKISANTTPRKISNGINDVYDIDNRFIIRIGTGADGVHFPKSSRLLRFLRSKISVQNVVFEDFSKEDIPYNVIVTTKLPGHSLSKVWRGMNTDDKEKVFEQLCKELSILHSQDIEEIRALVDDEFGFGEEIGQAEQDYDGAMRMGWVAPVKLERLLSFIKENLDLVKSDDALSLTHDDLHPNNIIVNGSEFAGLIDFEDARMASPTLDFSYILDPVASSEWEELGQNPTDSRKWILKYYQGFISTETIILWLKFYTALWALYDFGALPDQPVRNLLAGNLRYKAIFQDNWYEQIFG